MAKTTDRDPQPRARAQGEILAGRFRLDRKLGRGGFGEVWRASELLPDGSIVREVALKLMAKVATGDWAREAKVLAALRHPSLVTVFSAGILELEEPVPFVAMELLEGRTLADVVSERGPIPWRRALAYAREIAAALDAIHAQGIVHLDLKPSNLFLGEGGAIRVLDFGIARYRSGDAAPMPTATARDVPMATGDVLEREPPSSSSGRAPARPGVPNVVGTPGFMAPEVVEGRAATAAADAYALGAVLFQLLTARLPQRSRDVPRTSDPAHVAAWRAEVRASTVTGDLVEVATLVPKLPAAVAKLVRALLALDPEKRPRAGDLAKAVEEAWERPWGTPDPPYLGLRAYGAQAEGFLFGREADAARLARDLVDHPVLVLQGASGSGKSSLAVAGIVPALAKSFAEGCDDWIAVVVRPGQDVDGAVRRAREGAADGAIGVVVVVDQLEELVTQLSPEHRARFALSLRRFAEASPKVRVVATLREDFTTRVAALGEFGRVLESAVRFVPPPSAASVRDIVVGPALLAGVRVDDDKPIVDDVLKELRSGEGRLPLVSFALAEWWRTREGDTLTAAAWKRIGGVAGALSRHADATLAALPEEARRAARQALLRLVTPDGTRARVPLEELRAMGPLHGRALDAFEGARLVSEDDGAASLSHEALISGWSTLARWIEEERADRSEAAMLDAVAKAWRAAPAGDRDELLLRGGRLARALDLERRRPDLTAALVDFVGASRRRQTRDSIAKNAGIALLLAAAAGAVGYYYVTTERHAEQLRLREENMRALKQDAEQKLREAAHVKDDLAQRGAEIATLAGQVKSCKETVVRIEQEHRAELARRYPADSFEQKVVSFLLQWEHVWNLHDPDRIASFYAPQVTWLDFEGPREDLVRKLDDSWKKSPSNRLLIGEAAVTKREGSETTVRVTRDERAGGTTSLAVLRIVLEGDRPEKFAITKATVERWIVSGKTLGCP